MQSGRPAVTKQLFWALLVLVVSLALAGCSLEGPAPFVSPPASPALDGAARPVVPGTPAGADPLPPLTVPVASRTTVARSTASGWTTYASINQVNDVAFAPGNAPDAGELWASIWVDGGGGLVRWDLSTETYTWYEVDARQIATAPDGTLWAITGDGVCHFDGAACQIYGPAQEWLGSEARAIAVAPDGGVWLGTEVGISYFDGEAWQDLATGGQVQDLAIAADGEVWAATNGGVERYDPVQDVRTQYGPDEGLPAGQAQQIAVSPAGEVWTAILWEGVYHLDLRRGEGMWVKIENVCPGLITDLAVAANGTPWIAAGGGTHYPGGCLAYRGTEGWIDVAAEHGLVSIGAVALGPAGEVAASTSLGLGFYQDGAWRLLKEGPTRSDVRTVAVTPDGAAWFGFGDSSVSTTGGGLSRFDGQRWDYFLDDGEVGALSVAPDGTLWAGVGCSVQRFRSDAWETVAGCEDLAPGNVLDIAFTSDGAAWVSNGFGLGRYDGATWTLYDRMASFLAAAPAAVGRAGGLWLNGWTGAENSGYVGHFDGQEWTEYRLADSFPGTFLVSTVTAEGQVCGRAADWDLACFDGLGWTDGEAWTFYDTAGDLSLEGASLPVVAPQGAVGAGELWLYTREGLARLDGAGTPGAAWNVYRVQGAPGAPWAGAIAFGPAGEVWAGATRFRPPVSSGSVTPPASAFPTATAVAPPPGVVYRAGDVLWTGEGSQRVRLLDQTATAELSEARVSPDGSQILYLAGQGGDLDVWLADLDTGERRNLTRSPDRIERDPQWWAAHPGLVVFRSMPQEGAQAPEMGGYLTVVSSDGSGYRVLDDKVPAGGPPAASPAGSAIAYGRGSKGWLYQLGTDQARPGSTQRSPEQARTQATGVAMMPDDKQRLPPPIAEQMEPLDPVTYGLTGTGEIEIGNPAWSPEGQRLAWIVSGDLEGDGTFRWGVAVFDLEKPRAQVLHTYEAAGGRDWPPAPVWSPDGTWLAFAARTERTSEAGVWVVSAEGRGERARHVGGDHPVWSPDGRWLAFRTTGPDDSQAWLTAAGTWSLHALNLPPGAYVVDWIEAVPAGTGH